jgi:hypothetical protein
MRPPPSSVRSWWLGALLAVVGALALGGWPAAAMPTSLPALGGELVVAYLAPARAEKPVVRPIQNAPPAGQPTDRERPPPAPDPRERRPCKCLHRSTLAPSIDLN